MTSDVQVTIGEQRTLRPSPLVFMDWKCGEYLSGYGRWIYCKYCYKNVRPAILEELLEGKRYRMIVCNECNSCLTPTEEVGDCDEMVVAQGQ